MNLYAGWNLDSLNVMASLGYAMTDHEVKLNLPASMGMGQGKADVDTNAFIADLRAEYQIHTDVVDLLPHAGVRYTSLNTESHDLKVNGSVLNHVASDTQHIVQFPIGVTVSKDIDVSGWNVKPPADVSVIPAAGEKKNTTKVFHSGINAVDGVNTRIMDSTSWAGTVGIQAEKGQLRPWPELRHRPPATKPTRTSTSASAGSSDFPTRRRTGPFRHLLEGAVLSAQKMQDKRRRRYSGYRLRLFTLFQNALSAFFLPCTPRARRGGLPFWKPAPGRWRASSCRAASRPAIPRCAARGGACR